MKAVVTIGLLFWSEVLFADTLTLTSGENLIGAITAETNGTYQLRIANADYSIGSVRILPTNEVTAVVRDTPEQKAARADYETICRYRLQADREQPPAQCERVVTMLQQFLQDHPDNLVTPRVRDELKDEAAIKAIKEGYKDKEGKVVMKPSEGLSDDEVKGLVAYMRKFKQ